MSNLNSQPESSPYDKRASSYEFVEISDSEFQSVSSLVRGRVKLSDVNHVSNFTLEIAT